MMVMDFASTLQCMWAAVHLAGIAATFLIRAYAGARAETPLRVLYVVGLLSVAAATFAGEQLLWPLWIVSAATLAVMIVGAVADFGPQGCELQS
jgi:hypothetical protein